MSFFIKQSDMEFRFNDALLRGKLASKPFRRFGNGQAVRVGYLGHLGVQLMNAKRAHLLLSLHENPQSHNHPVSFRREAHLRGIESSEGLNPFRFAPLGMEDLPAERSIVGHAEREFWNKGRIKDVLDVAEVSKKFSPECPPASVQFGKDRWFILKFFDLLEVEGE